MTQSTPPAPPVLPPLAFEAAVALAVAATLAVAAAIGAGRVSRRLLTVTGRESLGAEPLVRQSLRLVRLLTFVAVFAILALPALDLAGVPMGAGLRSGELGQWAATTGVRILGLVVLAFVVVTVLTTVITRAEHDVDLGTGVDALERRKRAQTISQLVRRVLTGLVWTSAVLMILRELDVDVTPVLTGAGIVGLAIGFGAQTLVRDVISGFFLIVENQVRVGDVAMVNGIGGLVEAINLRTIVLRDLEGVVHVIPNGEIKTLANRTKDYSYYVIDLGIGYDADVDQVVALVKDAGASLQADPGFSPFILEPVEVLGVDGFTDSAVTLKMRIKTVPLKQWDVGRELRRRIKYEFDRAGLRLPVPQFDVRITGAGTSGDLAISDLAK